MKRLNPVGIDIKAFPDIDADDMYGCHCPAAPSSPGLSFHGLRALGPPAKAS